MKFTMSENWGVYIRYYKFKKLVALILQTNSKKKNQIINNFTLSIKQWLTILVLIFFVQSSSNSSLFCGKYNPSFVCIYKLLCVLVLYRFLFDFDEDLTDCFLGYQSGLEHSIEQPRPMVKKTKFDVKS